MSKLGFIGLGVMGEPMCRNLLELSGRLVIGHDLDRAPVERLRGAGLEPAADVAAVAAAAEVVLLSLPGGEALERVCTGDGGLLENARPGAMVIDTSTAPVPLTRRLATTFAERGVDFVDAPVARTRAAAAAGRLSIMVGGSDSQFLRARDVLDHMAEVVTHCGPVGAGQVVKQMNNMVLFQTVVALAEALATGRAAGVDGKLLFETLANGSADSFALRNHGMKAMLRDEFPTDAFSTEYASKDLRYALSLADSLGLALPGALTAAQRLADNAQDGRGDEYFPSLLRLYEAGGPRHRGRTTPP